MIAENKQNRQKEKQKKKPQPNRQPKNQKGLRPIRFPKDFSCGFKGVKEKPVQIAQKKIAFFKNNQKNRAENGKI